MEGDSIPKTEPQVESGLGSPKRANETVSTSDNRSEGDDEPRIKKRTKSGCLTCRKRRIKCDQGKPTCQNCIGSGRECGGYNQRFTFKEPMGALAALSPPHHYRRALSFLPQPAPELVFPKDTEARATPADSHSYDRIPRNDSRAPSMAGGQRSMRENPEKGMDDVDSDEKNPLLVSKLPDQGGEKPEKVRGYFAFDTDSMSMCDSDDDAAMPSPPEGLEQFLLQGIKSFHPLGVLNTPGITLTTYRPSFFDSPLTNPETAAIFWHFVTVTAPTISLYESNGMYNGRFSLMKPVPGIVPDAVPEVTVWTESFPVMSFQDPALMQAMLALASLQIAQLQQVPPTAALKHYHLALRRAAKSVQTPSRKGDPATFACLLLLAYFELWIGNLIKWRSHLTGLAEVFNDTKSTAIVTTAVNSVKTKIPAGSGSRIHDSPGHAIPQSPEAFEQLREIYWAQLRMDVYQSLLPPTPTHLSEGYRQDKYPPRAPIGDLKAIHGTSDYLTLLLREVTWFAASERDRKAKLSDSIGPRDAGDGITRGEGGAGKEELLDAWVAAKAVYDWEDLLRQFELFKEALEPEYGALAFGRDVNAKATSPFGPPLRYQIHGVAGVWMNFHMGLIQLHLLNPSLPPHSPIVAASMAAKSTSASVDHIGRILAGLAVKMDLPNATRINGADCAVLIESCVPVLLAGLQTVDQGRRDWLVKYLSDVERLTGCQLARYARDTCESSWLEHPAVGLGSPDEDQRGHTNRAPSSIPPKPTKDEAGNPISVAPTQHQQSPGGSGLRDVEENLERLDLVGASWPPDLFAFESAVLVGQGHEIVGGPEKSQSSPFVEDGSHTANRNRRRQGRQGPLTIEQRERAVLARKLGSCASCKMKRICCHPRHLDANWDETPTKKLKSSSPALPGGGALLNKTSPAFEFRMAQGDKASFGGSIPKTSESLKRPEGFSTHHDGRPDPRLDKQVNLVQGNPIRAEESHLSVDPGPGVALRPGSDLETENSWWSWGETDDDSEGSDTKSERDVDPTTRVVAILRRNKELVVREVAEYCRDLIGGRRIQVYGCNDAKSDPSASVAGVSGSGSAAARQGEGGTTKKAQTRVKGKERRGQDDENGDGDEKRRPNKRQRVLTQDLAAGGLKLACPYFRRNPKGPKISQSCGGPGWNTIHRLKEHLYRRHVCVRCLRCGASFRTEDELVTHSRAATACTVSCAVTDPDDGFEKHQEALLRRRWKVVSTTEDQWRHLYKILFPDDSDDLIPSPYYQDHRSIVDEFARFELFLRRETSRLLEERLNESLLGGTAGLDPSSLAGQLSNVVNEIQSAAIRSYREGGQVEPSEGGRAAEGINEGNQGSPDHATSMRSPSVDILDMLEHSTGQESLTAGANFGDTEDIESWYDLLVSGDADLVGYGGEEDLTGNDWNFQC